MRRLDMLISEKPAWCRYFGGHAMNSHSLRSVVGGFSRQAIYDRLAGGNSELPPRKILRTAEAIAVHLGMPTKQVFGHLAAGTIEAEQEDRSRIYVTNTLTLAVSKMLESAYRFEKVAFTENERAKFRELFLLTNNLDHAPTMEQLIRALIAVGFCKSDELIPAKGARHDHRATA